MITDFINDMLEGETITFHKRAGIVSIRTIVEGYMTNETFLTMKCIDDSKFDIVSSAAKRNRESLGHPPVREIAKRTDAIKDKDIRSEQINAKPPKP